MITLLTRAVRLTVAVLLLALTVASCATLKPNPTDSEIQQTRKIALKVFSAVEVAGTAVAGIQDFEIRLHDAGKVSDPAHRAFQTDLLITARMVRSGLTNIQLATRLPELRMTLQLIIDNLNDLKAKHGAAFPDLVPAIGIVSAGLSVIITMLGV